MTDVAVEVIAIIAKKLPTEGQKVELTANLRNVPLEAAVELLADMAGLGYVRRGNTERYANRQDFQQELEHGRILIGSPGTVRERLRAMLDESGANYVLGCFSFGSLTSEQTLRSVELFANEVMPALREPRAVTAR